MAGEHPGRACAAAALLQAALVLTLAAPVGAALPPARPYALRDIPLGMPLGEFRKVRHPDAQAHAAAKVHCSRDAGAGAIEALALPPHMIAADVVKCGFYELADAAEGERLSPASVTFLGEAVTPIFLFYRPDGEADHRLAQITFAMSNARGAETIGLFYRAYGNVASLDVIAVTTSFGSELPDIRYVWRNDLSTIRLDSLSFVLNEMSVVFYENKLWTSLSDRLDTIDRVARIAAQEESRRKAAEDAAKDAAPPAPAEP